MSQDFEHKLIIPRRYIKSHEYDELVTEVLNAFRQKEMKLTEISEKSGIPYGVIQYWHSRWVSNPAYYPGEAIGQHRKIFTPEQETNIAQMIKEQFIDHHVVIHRKHLRKLLFNMWQSLDPETRSDKKCDHFMTCTFIKRFCRRNKLSFRTMRTKKRSDIPIHEIKEFTKDCIEVFEEFAKDLIFNMDETAWNFVYKRGEVLAHRGVENVDAWLPDDFKKSFTVIATVTAVGGKLPPVFLATGKSYISIKQFEGMESEDDKYLLYHSGGGNSDDDSMKFYLDQVKKWSNGRNCALIMDRYSSHVSDSTTEYAANIGIRLVFVPTSGTEIYQPLDRKVFGILKSQAASDFGDKVFDFQEGYTKPEAADLFVTLWDNLKKNNIVKAWRLVLDEINGKSKDSNEDYLSQDESDSVKSDEEYID